MELLQVTKHLARYGYIPGKEEPGTKAIPETILKKYQEFHGLEATGTLDNATSELMRLPRCCNKDVMERPRDLEEEEHPSRHLTIFKSDVYKWEKKKLTWRVTKFSRNGMPEALVHEALRRAFYVWESHADLTFEWLERGLPDLEIRWEVGDHGDGSDNAFDGSGGTLAHAFFPQGDRLSGDLHFDDEEIWTLGTASVGVNLTQAAAHEIGHSLGLDHSSDSSALMAPVYRGYVEDFDLQPDDIAKIQALYGKPLNAPKPVAKEEEWIPKEDPGSGSGSGNPGTGDSGSGGPLLPFECPCPCSLM